MKTRIAIALVFVLGLGTSGFYSQTGSPQASHPTFSCCGGDPGAPIPPDTPQSPTPVPPPQPPTLK